MPATQSDAPLEVLASWLDMLQFAYLPLDQRPPKPKPKNVHKLKRLFECSTIFPYPDGCSAILAHPSASPGRLLDLFEMARHDAEVGVHETVRLHLLAQELARGRLPQDAERGILKIFYEFSRDSSKHGLVRRLAQDPFALARSINLAARSETTRRAAHLLCAISEAHASSGQWAASLQDLRGIPAECLIDPFSGKPFVYRLEDGKPKRYSVGMDGQDSGGKHSYRWGEDQPGSDYVFWPVQPRR